MNGVIFALAAALFLVPGNVWAAASPTKSLFDSTVCITGTRPDGSKLEGSGVIVEPGNRVLTVAHALRGTTEVRVRLYDGRIFPAELARFAAADIDLAVLELGNVTLPPAKLANSETAEVGDVVRSVGCPLGYDFTMTMGRVRGFRKLEGLPLIQTDVEVHPGSSGGPVFDENGQIIGVVKAQAQDAEDVNFALPSKLAQGFLRSLDSERQGFDAFNRAVAERDPTRKADLYREAVGILPDMAEPRYNLALTLENAGRVEDAMAQYREVIRRHPGYVPASLNLGAALYGLGNVDDAILVYQEALRHRPNSARVRNNLAEAYRKTGQIPRARTEFLRINEESPTYAPAQYGLALLYEEDLADPKNARAHYEQYLALVPDGPEAAEVRERLQIVKRNIR